MDENMNCLAYLEPLCRMQYIIWKILIEITVLVTSIESGNNDLNRSKRAQFDNFNVLLNLYKMNPLKKSQVYMSVFNRILLPNRDSNALNADLNESVFNKTRATLSVKQLENIINNTNSKFNQPNFDVENIDTEKFTIDIVNETVIESSSRKEDFEFEHLKSVEDDHIPVTKMLPVNNTNSFALLNTEYEIFESHSGKYANVNKVFSTVNDNAINIVSEHSKAIGGVKRNDFFDDGVISY